MDIRPIAPIYSGLTHSQVALRLRNEGYNELPSSKPRSLIAIAAEVIREPMLLLLIAAGAIYLILGDLKEALVLLASLFAVIGISLYQSHKTERTLEALRDLASPRALVIRDGNPAPLGSGRMPVQTAEQLLTHPERQARLQAMEDLTRVTPAHFETLYRQALRNYARFVQQLAASEAHHHAG